MVLRRSLSLLILSMVICCLPSALLAQTTSSDQHGGEAFIGYSWYHAGGNVKGDLPDFNEGWAGQLTYDLNHWAGITLDANGHYNDFGSIHTVTAGPQFRLQHGPVTPFAEVLFGFADVSPKHFVNGGAAAFIAGGGLEYKVNQHFSIRPAQFDLVSTSYNKLSKVGVTNQFTGARLQAGLSYLWGGEKPTPVSALCAAEPAVVDAGTPIKV
jgi:hypothetical protein